MRPLKLLFLCALVATGGCSGVVGKAFARKSSGPKVVITYELDEPSLVKSGLSKSTALQRVASILSQRAVDVGSSDTRVSLDEDDRIVAEVQGTVDAARVRTALSHVGDLKLYHASNLSTDRVPRVYTARPSEDPSAPRVYFTKLGSLKVIRPGDAEYNKIVSQWKPVLDRSDIDAAGIDSAAGGSYSPTMHFTSSGTAKMKRWCNTYYNTGENMAYVLDGVVLSVAPLAPNALISSDAVITGQFAAEYVRNMQTLLNGGALPVGIKEVSCHITKN